MLQEVGGQEAGGDHIAGAAANDLPVMFMTEESMVKGFGDIAADINDYVPAATVDNYQEGLLTSMMVDGKLLGAPFARSLPVMVVNKEILAQAGWTGSDIKTLDDLLQCAKEVYDATGIPGYATNPLRSTSTNWPFDKSPSSWRIWPNKRASVVLPVPGPP